MSQEVRIVFKGRIYTSYKSFYDANKKLAAVPYLNFRNRIAKGMSPIEALTKPSSKK